MNLKLYIILIIVFLLIVIYLIFLSAKLIYLKNRIVKSFDKLNLGMKRRWDLIPRLIEKFKNCGAYDKSTIEKMIILRNTTYKNMNNKRRLEVDDRLALHVSELMRLKESTYDHKKDDTISKLIDEYIKIDKEITDSKIEYKSLLLSYNKMIKKFPANFLVRIFGYTDSNNFLDKHR